MGLLNKSKNNAMKTKDFSSEFFLAWPEYLNGNDKEKLPKLIQNNIICDGCSKPFHAKSNMNLKETEQGWGKEQHLEKKILFTCPNCGRGLGLIVSRDYDY